MIVEVLVGTVVEVVVGANVVVTSEETTKQLLSVIKQLFAVIKCVPLAELPLTIYFKQKRPRSLNKKIGF